METFLIPALLNHGFHSGLGSTSIHVRRRTGNALG